MTRIYALWDRLSDFEPSQADKAISFFLQTLKDLTASDDAVWLGVIRMRHGKEAEADHQKGWRTRLVSHLEWTDLKRAVVAQAMKAQDQDGGVPSSIEMAKLAGNFRTLFLRELHDMESFMLTHHYQACFIPFDITDRVWCVFPVNDDCEVAVILDRFGSHPRFDEKDRALVSTAMRGLRWFHRRMVLAHGVMLGENHLSPRQQTLLGQLLSDKFEKEIAESLGLSPATVRGYTKTLYGKLGVRGRSGLMALWLGKA